MSILIEVKRRYNKWKAEEPERTRKKLERAKTVAAREKIRGEISRERMEVREQVAKAKTSLLRAEAEKKKAKKALREAGNGSDIFGGLSKFLGVESGSKKRTVRKHRTVRRKAPTRRKTSSRKRRQTRVEYF